MPNDEVRNVLYMQITRDKYELPMAVADSAAELARMIGVKPDTVRSAMCHDKKAGHKCSYIKVEIDEEVN